MEGVTAALYSGIRGYWRRNLGYRRVNSARRKRKMKVVELGSAAAVEGSSRRRRFWRIKLSPRLNLKLRFSPKKLLIGLRDAYVNMMLRIANTSAVSGGYGGSTMVGNGATGFGVRPLKEYDERMILEIYKSVVMAHPGLAPQLGIKC